MKTISLQTSDPNLQLVEPNVERDAALGVGWLAGDIGRNTLRLMGVNSADNKPSTLSQEKDRVQDFVVNQDHLNWMISYYGKIVGSVWVDLRPSDELPAPSVHIMIGDPDVRGRGIGTTTLTAVIAHLHTGNMQTIYSRHLLENRGSKHLLGGLGFKNLGEPYDDKDGLKFQNVILTP